MFNSIAFIIFAFANDQAQATPCRLDSVSNRVEIGQSVVYLNFQSHRSSKELALFEAILKNPAKLSQEMVPELHNMLSKIEPIMKLNAQLKDTRRLESLVNSKEINWLGVEYSRSEVESLDSNGLTGPQRFDLLRAQFERISQDRDFVDKMMLLFAGSSARYVWFSSQSVRKVIRLIPLENEELKTRGLELLTDIPFHRELLTTFTAKLNPQLAPHVDYVLARLDEMDEKQRTTITDAEIKDLVSRISDADARDFASKIFKEEREFSNIMLARSKKAAEALLNQEGSGWMSYGTGHKEEIMSELKRICGSGFTPDNLGDSAH